MTANQIAYSRLLEERRTHQVQEAETHRTNVTQEAERARANTLNYEASMYASNISRYNAELNSSTQRYAAELNYAASTYATHETVNQRNREMWSNFTLTQSAQGETRRHNAEMEKIQRAQAETGQYNAGTNFLNGVSKIIGALMPILY